MKTVRSFQATQGKFTAEVLDRSDELNTHQPTVVLSHLSSNQYRLAFFPEQWHDLVAAVEAAIAGFEGGDVAS